MKMKDIILMSTGSKQLTDFASCERGEDASKTEKTHDY